MKAGGGPTRLGVFASGEVGRRVVSTILERDASALAYVVVPSAAEGVDAPPHVPVLVWEPDRLLPRLAGDVPDIVLLAWWPLIVKPGFLKAGQRFTLNLHPSLLPHGRGKDPNFWALADGEPFGVTIHHVSPEIDAGDIAFQARIATSWEDTGETLHRKAQDELVRLVCDSLDAILALDIPRIAQDPTVSPTHFRRDLEPRSTIRLDGSYKARDLLNVLRARTFAPYPGCSFVDDGARYRVRVQIEKVTSDDE